jgi:DNA-binding PadR family transcriptional regulator
MSVPTPDEVVLGLVAVQPQHGYQLLEHFRSPTRLGRIWRLSTSQLYAVLKRLEGQGEIIGREMAQQDAPPRTEYAITDVGLERLMRWLNAEPGVSVRRVRVDFLSRLVIARLLKLPAKPLIERQCNVVERQRDQLAQENASDVIEAEALKLEIILYDAILKWIEQLEENL